MAAKAPLLLLAVQLALNVAWLWISAGLHWHDWAFVEIVIFWAVIAVSLRTYFPHPKLAGLPKSILRIAATPNIAVLAR